MQCNTVLHPPALAWQCQSFIVHVLCYPNWFTDCSCEGLHMQVMLVVLYVEKSLFRFCLFCSIWHCLDQIFFLNGCFYIKPHTGLNFCIYFRFILHLHVIKAAHKTIFNQILGVILTFNLLTPTIIEWSHKAVVQSN